jgi:hypothetical protein
MNPKNTGQGRTGTASQAPHRGPAQYTPQPSAGGYGPQRHRTGPHRNRTTGASRNTRHSQVQATMYRGNARQSRTGTPAAGASRNRRSWVGRLWTAGTPDRAAQEPHRRRLAKYTPRQGTDGYGHQDRRTGPRRNRVTGASWWSAQYTPQPGTGGYRPRGRRQGRTAGASRNTRHSPGTGDYKPRGCRQGRAGTPAAGTSRNTRRGRVQAAMDPAGTPTGPHRNRVTGASQGASAIHAAAGCRRL